METVQFQIPSTVAGSTLRKFVATLMLLELYTTSIIQSVAWSIETEAYLTRLGPLTPCIVQDCIILNHITLHACNQRLELIAYSFAIQN